MQQLVKRQQQTELTIHSAVALAASLRQLHQLPALFPAKAAQDFGRFVQAYTIPSLATVEEEAQAATYVVRHILDRMRRLAKAYGEWQSFDGSAYFDLTQQQFQQLVQVEERIGTVSCTFFVDPLLPSFQLACNTFLQNFAQSYQFRRQNSEMAEHFFHAVQPAMVAQWSKMQNVIGLVRNKLASDIDFLAMNGAEEERWRYQIIWEQPAAPALTESLTPALRQLLTLSLSHEFPLPSYRQPGRQRRLWLYREREKFRRRRS